MFFTTIKHAYYKFCSRRFLNSGAHYFQGILSGENLSNLKNRFKQFVPSDHILDQDVSTQHLLKGTALYDILNRFGRPAYIKANTYKGGVSHEILLYRRLIRGQKTKIIYHFINNQIASVSFKFTIANDQERERILQFVSERYLVNKPHPVSGNIENYYMDRLGNKLIIEDTFDITLTFLNHDPEIIQNTNAALYQQRYKQDRMVQSGKFELSF